MVKNLCNKYNCAHLIGMKCITRGPHNHSHKFYEIARNEFYTKCLLLLGQIRARLVLVILSFNFPLDDDHMTCAFYFLLYGINDAQKELHSWC